MTTADLLNRLDGIKKTAKGWSARCPAHGPDRNPSLSVCEGERGWLLYCFAGCTTEEVCHALGLDVRDLFYDDTPGSPSRPPSRTEPKPPSLLDLEYQGWVRATSLDLRALTVMDAAKGLDTSDWTDRDFAVAMGAVCRARVDLRAAERLHELAAAMRQTINRPRSAANEDRASVA